MKTYSVTRIVNGQKIALTIMSPTPGQVSRLADEAVAVRLGRKPNVRRARKVA